MKTRAIILAGGEGSRLGVLTAKRTKPAVPFAGKYRIIDFTLSNCVNSNLFDVMILAQYRPHSLVEHIGAGGPWDLNRDFTGGVRIYSPYKARRPTNWYLGTADAVQQNFSFIKSTNPDFVLILSGDHIYEMNYDALIAFHIDHRADVTLGTITVPIEDASRFGIVDLDNNYRVTSFVEKPDDPPSNQVNMGVYLFSMDVLDRVLWQDYTSKDSAHDFGKNILPNLVAEGARVYAFPFSGYWVDVGTKNSYWGAHMDLLANSPPLDLNDRSWIIHTRTEERAPVRIASGAQVHDSMITDGCVISKGAIVEKSVLGPGVRIKSGAIVRESVILTDCEIQAGAIVERAIIDKRVQVGKNAFVGKINSKTPPQLVMIGKNSLVPPGFTIEPDTTIPADIREADYPSNTIKSNTKFKRGQKIPYEI
ncbi:MAG: NTP transferase domain-containing protein [Anaerolineales bacterium]|nr:NTP transferase domain-containing protein [Chloroflexota bacterium]MBL6980166.1 NTP transferase domain-containing protein [Anaerolineales bacterium]